MSTNTAESLRDEVRKRYAEAARAVGEGRGCGCGEGSCCDGSASADFGEALYSAEERGELVNLLRRALESAPGQPLWTSEEGD